MSIKAFAKALIANNSIISAVCKGDSTADQSVEHAVSGTSGSLWLRSIRDYGLLITFDLTLVQDLPLAIPAANVLFLGGYSGVSCITTGNNHPLEEGRLYSKVDSLMPRNTIYRGGSDLRGVFLVIDPDKYQSHISEMYPDADIDPAESLHKAHGTKCPPDIYQIFSQVRSYHDAADPSLNVIFYESKFNEILSLVMHRDFTSHIAVSRSQAKMEDLQAISKVTDFMDNHLSENPSLIELAQYVYMSPSKLKSLFKEVTGYTIREYRAHRRLYLSKELLENSNLPIREIAARCGYKKLENFNIFFRKEMNVSPKEYRSALRQRAVKRI